MAQQQLCLKEVVKQRLVTIKEDFNQRSNQKGAKYSPRAQYIHENDSSMLMNGYLIGLISLTIL